MLATDGVTRGRGWMGHDQPGMYIVEILRGGEDLLYEMDEMNHWMDQHVRPPKIQYYWVAEVLVFRVAFETVSGATTFARAFDGRLLDPRTPEPDAFAPRRKPDRLSTA